jgi:hypothetical protein
MKGGIKREKHGEELKEHDLLENNARSIAIPDIQKISFLQVTDTENTSETVLKEERGKGREGGTTGYLAKRGWLITTASVRNSITHLSTGEAQASRLQHPWHCFLQCH